MRNTKFAGVTRVGKVAANAAFEVGPTERVATAEIVRRHLLGIIMLEEMRPKYDSDANAGVVARRTTRDVTSSSTRSSASSTCSS